MTRKLRVNWLGGLKLRSQPEPTDASYTGIRVPYGAIVEAIGEPLRYDERFTFQQVRTAEGQQGWLTCQDGDTVYLEPVEEEPRRETPPVEGKKLRVVWSPGLRLRALPEPGMASFTGVTVPNGAVVTAIGEPQPYPGGYLFQRVRTPEGQIGWLTSRYGDVVYLAELEGEEATLWVNWFDGLRLRERPEPDLASFTGVIVPYGTQVTALGAPQAHPEGYRFQKVRLPDGKIGWLTLSYGDTVYLSETRPEPAAKPIPIAQVSGAADMWAEMRASPAPSAPVEWCVGGAVPLRVIDPVGAAARIGQPDQWIEVETPAFKRGFINARYLKPFTPGVRKQVVRRGESPYIYGIHDRYERKILTQVGVTGWVLFTYALGTNYQSVGGDRDTFYEWEREGFGILARLNYGYGSSGTIPEPHLYDDFARTCAAFVRRSIDPADPRGGCHIWIIGNEMNNPREYPGNRDGAGGKPITPEMYADCFNRTYRAIKEVYTSIPGVNPSDAMVVMGAVDPYNAVAGCSGDWFIRALRGIKALDGFALHAYTHGTDPALITSRKLFGDEHKPPKRFPDKNLSWQYYNFYAYRTFMDLIPARWRDVPVFITETDQVHKDWANANTGWVKEMYAEVNRWNSDPNRQRICCALLFRWEAFDGWQIKDKSGVLEDLKEAAQKKYKWTVE